VPKGPAPQVLAGASADGPYSGGVFTAILVLLLLAALLGVLGAVLKVALVLTLGFVLAVIVLAWGAWWWLKRRVREFEREVDRERQERDRRRRAIDVRHVPNEADGTTSSPARELTDGDLP
jgi:threonine/homoserine/homoserine lactone efflux protein